MKFRWLKRWKVYVSYNELTSNKQPSPYFGGPIPSVINEDLLDKSVDHCFKYVPLKEHIWNIYTKENLQEMVDYEIVNKKIWSFFSNRYDGLQIMRRAEGEGKNKIVIVNLLKVIHHNIRFLFLVLGNTYLSELYS
jgi:ubiquitin carboxyl-terminal hydrolase 4/11/15